MVSIASPTLWIVFFSIVLIMLAIDLFLVGGGKAHKVSLREAATWSVIWVTVSMAFATGLWFYLDAEQGRALANAKTLEFVTGYLIEKSLAVDNVFVWLMIFSYFAVPAELQKRVLIYGVLGAIVMRTIMIFAGVWLIQRFDWILYVFGAFLVFSGIKMWLFAEASPDLSKNAALLWLRKHLRLTDELDGEKFTVIKPHKKTGKLVRYGTPLLLVLILVEITDLIFAVDSIPAIFAISTDPFIVFIRMSLRA